jgi:hypothetical protein
MAEQQSWFEELGEAVRQALWREGRGQKGPDLPESPHRGCRNGSSWSPWTWCLDTEAPGVVGAPSLAQSLEKAELVRVLDVETDRRTL